MKILVFGATSAIVAASCQSLLAKLTRQKRPCAFYLVGRNPQKLANLSALLQSRGATVYSESLDLKDLDVIAPTLNKANMTLGGIDTLLIGHGTLLRQDICQSDHNALTQIVQENFTSQVAIINEGAVQLNQGGTIAVISSVASEAARPSSASYSATKAALARYIQGMHGALAPQKIRIIDIRPGWVETPMVADSKSKFATVAPRVAGKDIAAAILGRRPAILYTPWFWRFIMMPIKALPMQFFRLLRSKVF